MSDKVGEALLKKQLRKAKADLKKATATLDRIHRILDDGEEWEVDTIELVADAMTDHGYVISDPNDLDEDGDPNDPDGDDK